MGPLSGFNRFTLVLILVAFCVVFLLKETLEVRDDHLRVSSTLTVDVAERDDQNVDESKGNLAPRVFFGNPDGPKNLQPPLMNATIAPSRDQANPLVAVCLTGLARSFTSPIVFKSIKANLIDRLSKHTHIIANIKLQSDVGKQEETPDINYRVKPFPPANRSAVEHALKYLNPTVARISSPQERTKVEYQCRLDRRYDKVKIFSKNETWARRYLEQMRDLWDCMKEVEHLERSNNVSFAAVVRARPDSVWLRPINMSAKGMLDSKPGVVQHMWDHFIFAPREGTKVFSNFWDEYTKCFDVWKGPYSPEDAFREAAQKFNIKYIEQKFPTALKRESRWRRNSHLVCRYQKLVPVDECLDIVYADDPRKQGRYR